MRYEGVIKNWNAERGFGFITSDQIRGDVFVHVKALGEFRGAMAPNTRVTFLLENAPQGKRRATQVLLVESASALKLELKGRSNFRAVQPKAVPETAPLPRPRPRLTTNQGAARWNVGNLLTIPAFLVCFLAIDTAGTLPDWTIWAYLSVSAMTFVIYAVDKASAKLRSQRVSEATLHLLSLLGGWPGAILAQELLRHKSAKQEFRAMFWCTVVVNMGILIWLASSLNPLTTSQ